MAAENEVNDFLQIFRLKFSIWGVIFRDDRSKNSQTLLDLDITTAYRDKILKELDFDDYYRGPIPDTLNRAADMWVFKKIIKGQDVYIKITLGFVGTSVICISFHC